jgi:hypothetical protein
MLSDRKNQRPASPAGLSFSTFKATQSIWKTYRRLGHAIGSGTNEIQPTLHSRCVTRSTTRFLEVFFGTQLVTEHRSARNSSGSIQCDLKSFKP